MTRDTLISILKEREGTAIDLAKLFGRSAAAIEEDLSHIRTTLRNDSEFRLLIQPAQCLLCDYLFPNTKTKTPTRCPECKREKIRSPKFKIDRL